MIQRLKNLWAWSALDPYKLGAETGKAIAEAMRYEPAQIVYPNKVEEILKAKPGATLDELVS